MVKLPLKFQAALLEDQHVGCSETTQDTVVPKQYNVITAPVNQDVIWRKKPSMQ